MSHKKSKSKKCIYYNKSRITKNYYYFDNVTIEINNGKSKNSKIDHNSIVSLILVLFWFIILWKFGILAIVKTKWEDIEPMVEVLGFLYLLVKRFVVEWNES